MDESKTNSKNARNVIFWIIGILVLLIALWFMSQFIISHRNKDYGSSDITPTKPIIIPTDEPLVTPTIVPSAKSGWNTFIYSDPNTQYSFDYPSSWGLVEISHNKIVRLNFAGHCRVEFSNLSSQNSGNNNQPSENKTYSGRNFQEITLKKNNSPYIETYLLSNVTSKDGFSVVTVDLPPSNISQCQQNVDQILSSLKYGQL
jgi:hypothetical protein